MTPDEQVVRLAEATVRLELARLELAAFADQVRRSLEGEG